MTKQAGSMTNNVTHDALQGNATKRLIATFPGEHFVSERDGSDLKIFAIGDFDGLPGVNVLGNITGDAAGAAGLRALNKLNASRRGEGGA